ncbi:MAG: cytochrome c biogenesis protein CcdA [Planctomycetota bacterium]
MRFPRLTAALLVGLTMATAAPAQFGFLSGDKDDAGFGGFGAQEPSDPVTVDAQFTAATADRPAVLMVTAEIQPGWYVYSITQPAGGPQRTKITLSEPDGVTLLGEWRATPAPESHIDQEVWPGLEIQEHAEQVTWYVPIALPTDADPATTAIAGRVRLQACKEACLPLTLDFQARLGEGAEIGPLNLTAPAPGGATAAQPPAPTPAPPAAPTTPATGGEPFALDKITFAENAEVADDGSLAWYLTLAFFGGLALNLMPCVLPVIGLKVMSFVDQAGHSRTQAFVLNLWYSLGIISVFLVLAGLAMVAGLSWGEQLSSKTFTIVMASIVFVMALSLLGVWEIPIPGFLGSGKAQEAASQEGALGALLKGVITTLLATPCTGPGMGAALGWAIRQPPGVTLSVFFVLGLGMASPYLLIGAFPSLVRFLPKPGAWMETFKQLMGFVLIATVLFLLAILPTTYLLPTLVLLTCLALACWVYAKTPLTASTNDWNQTYGLCSAITVGGAVLAFGWLQPLLSAPVDADWKPFSLASLKQVAVEDGKTVLVDFSADWCANCKVLEKAVLHTEPVEKAIDRNGVVTMYADNTDYPPEIEETLRALRANGVPVISVFPGGDPYRPIVFRGGYTQDGLIDAIEYATSAKTRETVASRGIESTRE